MRAEAKTVKVWDPLVRFGHWMLAAGFLIAYLSAEEARSVHVWAGYLVGAIVLIRILWGFVGPKHARFRNFVRSPLAAWRYLSGLFSRSPRHYLGHNPAAGLMIVALLVSLAGTVGTGMVVLAEEEGTGPLAPWFAATATPGFVDFALPAAQADDDRDEDEHEGGGHARDGAAEQWEEVHEFFANFTLGLVLFHVVGVMLSSLVHRENLVRSMFTGRKRRDDRAMDEPLKGSGTFL